MKAENWATPKLTDTRKARPLKDTIRYVTAFRPKSGGETGGEDLCEASRGWI